MGASVHETINRMAKARAIVSLVPVGDTALQNIQIAANLETWTQADRDILAKAAGYEAVSEATWVVVVELVRGRAGEAVKVEPYRLQERRG